MTDLCRISAGNIATKMVSQLKKAVGWDGRIRTYNLRYQKALPCH